MEEKMYKAKIEIGGYKVGDEVPANKAKLWMEMYKESPVEEIGADAPKGEDGDLSPSNPNAEAGNAMHDDYLNRNADVVKKAIKDDKLDKSTLDSLIKLESKDKKRKPIIEALNLKMKSL